MIGDGETATGVRQQAVGEFEIGDRRQVDAIGVGLRHRLDANRPVAGDEADEADGVAPGIVERTAAVPG